MRRAFVVVSTVTLIVFAFQFVFAAVGAFTEPSSDSAYALHGITGMAVIPALTLLTTLFAALAKAPGRLVGLAILPLGLTVLQALLAALPEAFADESGSSTVVGLIFGALHAVNGIIAVHVVVRVVRGANRLAAAGPSDPAPAGAPETASPGASGHISPGASGHISPGASGHVSPGASGLVSPGASGAASLGPASPDTSEAASLRAAGRGEAT